MELTENSTMKEALDVRNDVDYRAYCLIINEILPWIENDKDFKEWFDGKREWEGATDDLMQTIGEIKKDRFKANQAFLQAIKEKRF